MLKKDNSKIQIVGAGIAGMTAAINLAKNGKSVIIYEKKNCIGGSRDGDFEGLENWIFSKGLPDSVAECGIDFNSIPKTPIFEFFVHVKGKQPIRVKSQDPFFHIVNRGTSSDSFDNYLTEICKSLNIEFLFNQNLIKSKPQISVPPRSRPQIHIRTLRSARAFSN